MTRDPATLAEDAAVLLRSGRADMALTVLEALPALLRQHAPASSKARGRPAPSTTAKVELAQMQAELARVRAEASDAAAEVGRHRRELTPLRAEVIALVGKIERQRFELAQLRQASDAELVQLYAAARKRIEAAGTVAARRIVSLKPHDRLGAALAAQLVTAEEIAALLKLRTTDLPPIVEGRVKLTQAAWTKVLDAIEAASADRDGPTPPRAA